MWGSRLWPSMTGSYGHTCVLKHNWATFTFFSPFNWLVHHELKHPLTSRSRCAYFPSNYFTRISGSHPSAIRTLFKFVASSYPSWLFYTTWYGERTSNINTICHHSSSTTSTLLPFPVTLYIWLTFILQDTFIETDDWLVRRSKVKEAFKVCITFKVARWYWLFGLTFCQIKDRYVV